MSVICEHKYLKSLTNFSGVPFTIQFLFLDVPRFSNICFVLVLFNLRPTCRAVVSNDYVLVLLI